MCIITFDNRRDNTDRISKKILRRCLEKNPHGMGIMFPRDGSLITWRTMDDFKGLWTRYCNARNEQLPVALHFRKNTKGDSTVLNCHPFITHNGMAFMHNGTIDGIGELPKGVSDTQHFRNEVLSKLPGKFLQSQAMYNMVRSFLRGDRALFMDNVGGYTIMNESTGVWEFTEDSKKRDGVWFSHKRDREYFMTGKEKKIYTNDNWQVDRNWYTKSPTEQTHMKKRQVNDPSKRVSSKISAKYSSTNDILLFVYGHLRDDVPGDKFIDKWDASYVGKGFAKDVQLWQIEDPNNEYGRPGAMQMKPGGTFTTFGHLLTIRGASNKTLATIDTTMGIIGKQVETHGVRYYRTKINVTFTESVDQNNIGETHSAWAYLATPVQQINPIGSPVPMGDWTEWLRRMDEEIKNRTITDKTRLLSPGSGDDDIIFIDSYKFDGDGEEYSDDTLFTAYDEDEGNYVCLICDTSEAVPFNGIGMFTNRPTDEAIHMYWCDNCNDQYPVEMFDSEIEAILHGILASHN
jgi:hypothetical protein